MNTQPVERRWHLATEADSAALGAALGQALAAQRDAAECDGLAIGLAGDLGAGKTTVVRALLRALGVEGSVKSPTYALLEPYEASRLNLYHFDFYRFKRPEDFDAAGFGEYFGPGNVCLVEWPQHAGARLPALDLEVALEVCDAGRDVTLRARTENGARCLERVMAVEGLCGGA
jgi:tRNA threonylcarbamoyladenosine biosynthesis protein TsaE